MPDYWVDVVYCRNCNATHGEDKIAECQHCEKDVCPSCGDVNIDDGMPWGYHKVCAAWVDGESDIDPLKAAIKETPDDQ